MLTCSEMKELFIVNLKRNIFYNKLINYLFLYLLGGFMKKIFSKVLLLILFAFCTFIYIGCAPENEDADANSKVEMVDLAKTYEGEVTDIDGNLLVPFDVAYSEVFENGNYKFNEEYVLVKVKNTFNDKYINNPKKYDEEFGLCGVKSIEKMYDVTNDNVVSGTWYKAKLKRNTDPVNAIKYLRSLSYVMVAELDYIYDVESVDDAVIYSESSTNSINDSTDVSWCNGKVHKNKLLKEQDYLKESDLQKAWKFLEDNGMEPGGLSSTVVAVIDTGVDYTHPDLKDNMWVNVNEIPGNGIDDDNNGYIDDVHGANVIANNGNADMKNTGNPMDDHGHGTHVAGIIGASNNEEGVVGIAYNAKIMAVKAGQTSGYFNQSDIAEAILYAYSMGAEVINMSFGGSACTMAVQDALQTAYTSSVLVASAGNDTAANEPLLGWDGKVIPNYPAALSYVVGVMSVGRNGYESSFTNFDSKEYNSLEYEVYAIGEKIMSTLPNGKYGKLSGTSMSAPVVSGTAALLRSYYSDRNMYPSKFIMAQLSSTSEEYAKCIHKVDHNMPMILNINDALTKLPKPDVNLYDRYFFDTESISSNNNGDGVVDAGETLNIGLILKNIWGMSKDTIVTVTDTNDLGGDDPYVEIINGTVNFNGVGTYQTKDNLIQDENYKYTGVENPVIVKIAKNCPNDYIVKLNIEIEYMNGLDEKDASKYSNTSTIEFSVRNGVEIKGKITEDMTFTNDNYYIIPDTLYIAEGATVTIEEGTKIQFWSADPEDVYATEGIAKIEVDGELIFNGTLENPIEIYPSDLMYKYEVNIMKNNGYIELNYVNITNPRIFADRASYCKFTDWIPDENDLEYNDTIYTKSVNNGVVESKGNSTHINIFKALKCVFDNINNTHHRTTLNGEFENCLFNKCSIEYQGNMKNCMFLALSNYVNEDQLSHLNINSIKETLNDSSSCKILYDEIKNKYYALVKANPYILDNFSKTIGGSLLMLETEEEYNKFVDMFFSVSYYLSQGLIGIYGDSDKWYDGTPLGNYINLPTNTNGWYYIKGFNENPGNVFFITNYVNSETSTDTYIEFPAEINGVDYKDTLTIDMLNDLYNEWLNSSEFIHPLDNSVIINNFNDSSSWIKIIGEESTNYNDKSVVLNNCYFGTTDEFLINQIIYDNDDNLNYSDIINNYATVAPSDTFPFIVDSYILDSNGERVTKVGNEEVTFVVEFNRNMDTTVPLRFRFGSFYPYADYEVVGEYVSPREWRGKYYLNTTIENGNMYFNIENGRAADDKGLELYTLPGRFKFEIDTTLAQAMIMQGEATDTGINLTWMQDDFDTLLGYNIYRSTEEDGLYTRLNDYVLSYDENTFFDDTVEPGVMYYYNFTVVKTDLTESTPSGKIVITSKDTMAPNIYHTPIALAYTNNNILVNATVIDNLQIDSVKLYYKSSNSSEWKFVMMNAVNNKYMGLITSDNITINGLDYYIEAYDGISYTYIGSKEDPYKIQIKEELSKSSYGDVDGDGSITVKDAQMLLMAINDLLNLNADEFVRADIDKNGKLEAFEALRILDYISGKINYIV